MIDKFDNFVSYGIYKIDEVEKQNNNEDTFIKLELSVDQFNNFCSNIRKSPINIPTEIVIYDEGIINGYYDRESRKRIIRTLNKMNIKNITFILSDNTISEYNYLMNVLCWKHQKNTTLKIKIDRNPLDTEVRNWNLDRALGRIELPEEKLIWIPDNELEKAQKKIDKETIQNAYRLKEILFILDNYLRKTYRIDDMSKYEKALAIYKYLKNYTLLTNMNQSVNDSKQSTVLMTALLNNPLIKIDATVIEGIKNKEAHNWTGIVIDNKLYHCCHQNGIFINIDELHYTISDNQIYPAIYENDYLETKDIKNIESKLKKLKR